MKKRILRTLTIAVVLGIAIPVASAAARPNDSQVGVSTKSSSTAIVSENTSGQNSALSMSSSSPLVSENSAGQNAELAMSSSTSLVSENSAGQNPSQPELASVGSAGTGFDWSNVAIGGGVAAAMLAALGAALVMRRRQGTLAH